MEERLQKLEHAAEENRTQIETSTAHMFTPSESEYPQPSAHAELPQSVPAQEKDDTDLSADPSLQKLTMDTATAQNRYNEVLQAFTAKEAELKDLDQKLRTIDEELTRKKTDLNALEDKLRVYEERLASGETELTSLQEKFRVANDDLNRSKVTLESQNEELRTTNENLARRRTDMSALQHQIERERDQSRKNQQNALEEYKILRTKIDKEQEGFASFQLKIKETNSMRERIWPPWMLNPEFENWKVDLEKSIITPDSPPSVGLLFAAIHSHSAAIRDTDPKTLIDSLRDIGRRLYAWLRDRGLSEEECADASEEWGKAINQHCAGAAKVDVPRPGNAAEVSWMTFQPRGGSAPDVVSVRNWCVRDAQSRPAHRAEVIV